MIAILRSIIYNIAFHSIGSLLVIFALICSLAGQDGVIFGARCWAKWQGLCARFILGIRFKFEGTIDQSQALYVIKHESMLEAMQTLTFFDRPIVVMKDELLHIPLWGRASRLHGSIGVERDAGGSAMRAMIASAKAGKATGRPIVLFPEGTRVAVGESPELKAGMAGLYKILGLKVVPIALNTGRLWPRGFTKYAGVVTVKIGETIPAGLPREEIEARVHQAINALNAPSTRA